VNLTNRLPRFLIALSLASSIAYSQQTANQVILHQNYPDPTNPTTIINYQIFETGHVSLKVYDVLGRVVKTLVDEWETAGSHRVIFSAANLSSGMYFYNLRVGQISETKRLIFLK